MIRIKVKILLLCVLQLFFFHLKAETHYWNKGRGYRPFVYATENGIVINNTTDSLQYDYYPLPFFTNEFNLKFRAKNLNGEPGKKYEYNTRDGKRGKEQNPNWGFFITSQEDTLLVRVTAGEKITPVESDPCLNISVFKGSLKRKERELQLTNSINPFSGDNLWELKFSHGKVSIYAGDHKQPEIYSSDFGKRITGFGFYAGWGANLKVSDIRMDYGSKASSLPSFSTDNLDDYFSKSEDPLEGYWTLFDRELEESLLKMGGNYTLACVKEDENDYNFIYIEGASVNSNEWHPGDIKMKMQSSNFPGIYNVEWVDSMKEKMAHEIKAQRGEGNTLLIQFPYQGSKLRLRKITP